MTIMMTMIVNIEFNNYDELYINLITNKKYIIICFRNKKNYANIFLGYIGLLCEPSIFINFTLIFN